MKRFDYAAEGVAVRDAIAEQHRRSGGAIAGAGSQLPRQEAARAARVDPPWLREGLPDPERRRPDAAQAPDRSFAPPSRE